MGIIFNMYANECKDKFPTMKIWNCDDPPQLAGDCTFDGPSVYPEYLTDVGICVCPSDSDADRLFDGFHENGDPSLPVEPCRLARGSYYYTGWAFYEPALVLPGVTVPTDVTVDFGSATDVLTFALSLVNEDVVNTIYDMYSNGLSAEARHEDLGPVPRLRLGIERFFITDINNPAATAAAASAIPVMWDEIAVYGGSGTFNHVPGGGNCLYMDGHVEWLPWHSEFPSNLLGVLLSTVF